MGEERHTFGRGRCSADAVHCSEDGSEDSEFIEDVELHIGLICEDFYWVLCEFVIRELAGVSKLHSPAYIPEKLIHISDNR